jgi:hypothetical protein
MVIIIFLYTILLYYQSRCDALTAVLLSNSSIMDTIEPLTPQYPFAKSSFNITASIKEMNDWECSHCKLDTSSTNKIVIMYQSQIYCAINQISDSC